MSIIRLDGLRSAMPGVAELTRRQVRERPSPRTSTGRRSSISRAPTTGKDGEREGFSRMTFLSRFRYRASAAVVLAGVLISSGCGGAQKSPRALTADEVTGTWTGEGGATVSISGDHRFSVDAQLGTGFLEKVGQTRTGSWKFVDLGEGRTPVSSLSSLWPLRPTKPRCRSTSCHSRTALRSTCASTESLTSPARATSSVGTPSGSAD